MAPSHAHLIAVDWGTSSFRAYLVDASGATIDRVESTDGILGLAKENFPTILQRNIAPWITRLGPLPIIMSGMIGSRQGWHETPYVSTPATLSHLLAAVQTITIDGLGTILIAPGVMTRDSVGMADVMRGEEIQVFGALALTQEADGLFVLPGTHSKWVTVDNGAITSFQSYMTGELFAVLREHSILGRLIPKDVAPTTSITPGFRRGLATMSQHGGGPGGLLNRLFTVRTLGLFSELPKEQLADYLSGLLIGAEIVEAAVSDQTVTIIANDALAARYKLGCQTFAIPMRTIAQDCAVAGQLAIAAAKTLLGESAPS
jgi:2-dehydro-3-deoxygalactonokinase